MSTKTFSVSNQKWLKEHYLRQEFYAERVKRLYQDYIIEASKIAQSLQPDPKKPFLFKNYSAGTQNQVNQMLQDFAAKMIYQTNEMTEREWLYASMKNDDLVRAVLDTSLLAKPELDKMMNRNFEALQSFQNRKVGGLRLSDRVWNYTGQFKQELELAMDLGIGQGKSAHKLALETMKYLQQPDELFNKFVDKNGLLEFDKYDKVSNPGRGVYRSSYANAFRMVAEETNQAYRMSDHIRQSQLDFVVGYEIKVSNNHPVRDICDDLQGKYPKGFVWTGWHVRCRCNKFTILATDDEFNQMELNTLQGKSNRDFKSENAVENVPDGFKEWVNKNRLRIENAKYVPGFIGENKKFVRDATVTVNDVLSNARGNHAFFTDKSLGIAKQMGVKVSDTNLKKEDSILRKVNSDYNGDFTQVKDSIRNTFVAPAGKHKAIIEKLKSEFDVVKVKHQAGDAMGYSGTIVNVKLNNGIIGEIQVNTKQMIYAKDTSGIKIIGEKEARSIFNQTGLEPGKGHTFYEEHRLIKAKGKNVTMQDIKRMREIERQSTLYYEAIRKAK